MTAQSCSASQATIQEKSPHNRSFSTGWDQEDHDQTSRLFWVAHEGITKSIQGSVNIPGQRKQELSESKGGSAMTRAALAAWLWVQECSSQEGAWSRDRHPCILWPWVWVAHMWSSQDTVLLSPPGAWILNSKSLGSDRFIPNCIQIYSIPGLTESEFESRVFNRKRFLCFHWLKIQKVKKDTLLTLLHGFTSMIKHDKSVSADLCILEKQT